MDKDFRERQEHINSEKTKDNITLRHVLLAEAYHNLFDHAQEEYNQKQIEKKHPERQIKNYLEKVRNTDRKNVAYEIIVQVGDRKNTGTNDYTEINIMKEYLKEFEERNPNFLVFGCYIHRDEATTHMHLDYIPVGHMKKGMEIQNILKQALYEQGYVTAKGKGTAQEQWTRDERAQLERLCHEHGIEIEHKRENREHLETEKYILYSQNKELEKENRKMNDRLDKKELQYRQAEKAEIPPLIPKRTLTGKEVVDYASHKALIDKANAENYRLQRELTDQKNQALSHAFAREQLEKGLRAENARYIERDKEVEILRNILENSDKPKEDYMDFLERDPEYEPDRDITIAR